MRDGVNPARRKPAGAVFAPVGHPRAGRDEGAPTGRLLRRIVSLAMTLAASPRPGLAEKITGGYVVRDANGQALKRSGGDAGRGALPEDEARRVAVNIAKLPALLQLWE